MSKVKKFFRKKVNNIFLNYHRPYYNKYIYDIAQRYVHFYKGECNPDMHTNGEVFFLREILRPDLSGWKVIFDVGANEGNYTDNIVKINNEGFAVHCFEPNPESFSILKDKFRDSKNIICNNIALSDSEDEKNFYFNIKSSTASSFYEMDGFTDRDFLIKKIKTLTLDNYCQEMKIQNIDLLKIDVEGHELSVLLGSSSMFKNGLINFVQFEFGHASFNARVFFYDYMNFFKNFGYKVYKLRSEGLEEISYSPFMEKCPYANFVAVRNKSDVSHLLTVNRTY